MNRSTIAAFTASAAAASACGAPPQAEIGSPASIETPQHREETPQTSTTVTISSAVVPQSASTFTLPEDEGPDDDASWWMGLEGFDGRYPAGQCGGDLPPCWVLARESGGNIEAVNHTGCGGRGCYGKWQFDPRTSRGLGYEGTMDQYPEQVQDEAARTLWANGQGCSHWAACG